MCILWLIIPYLHYYQNLDKYFFALSSGSEASFHFSWTAWQCKGLWLHWSTRPLESSHDHEQDLASWIFRQKYLVCLLTSNLQVILWISFLYVQGKATFYIMYVLYLAHYCNLCILCLYISLTITVRISIISK